MKNKFYYLNQFILAITGMVSFSSLPGVISPAIAQEEIFLDYRTEEDYSMRTIRNSPALSTKIRQQVFSQVVKKSDKACFGKLEPKIRDSAIGSFTKINTQQIAYIVDLGDSCHSRYRGTLRLAIFNGDRLVIMDDITGYNRIKLVSDINENGLDEITLEGGGMGQGIFVVSAKTMEATDLGITTLGIFPSVYGNNFTANRSPLSRSASVISVKRNRLGKMIFVQERYDSACTGQEPRIECQDYELR